MEACAKAKFQRYGSRKVNLVLDQIRGKNVKAAEDALRIWWPKPSTAPRRTWK